MEFWEAIHSNGTCRYYRPDPVPDAVLERALSAARFAPSGGNRQPVRFVVIRDAKKKRTLRDLYLPYWESYFKGRRGEQLRAAGLPRLVKTADDFARHLDEVPVLIAVCAALDDVHPTDAELGRLSVVGGASIYPAVQNMLLACRAEGLGSALTTLLCHEEPRVKELLGIPADISTCAVVAVGYPAHPFPRKLKRRPLGEIAFLERYGEAFPSRGDT